MSREVNADVVVVGGGIAGLWLLNRLKQQGYSALLFEKEYLGGGQTIRSQGIIHGGAKYALHGAATSASQSIADMPNVWRQCLQGEGELNLSQVKILSDHQYVWTDNSIMTKLTGFFASRAMKDRMAKLQQDQFPDVFLNRLFKGSVYQLDEPVVDIPSLVTALVKPVKDCIVGFDWQQAEMTMSDQGIDSVLLSRDKNTALLKAKHFVFAAGEGNAAILEAMGFDRPQMQTRPLHMTYLKGDLPELYAHRLQPSSKPRITITTHTLSHGGNAWYLGGDLAETGVDRTRPEQIAMARQELEAMLPWVDLTGTKWNSFHVNRAEIASNAKRPDKPGWQRQGNVTVAWSTKLAFAPMLAKEIMSEALLDVFPSEQGDVSGFESFNKPQIAEPVWGS